MNPRGKKFIALFLAFSLVMLSANLYAKERRGAKLLITKKDGQQIKGELITVKPNSLLLLSITGRDMSVDIAEIRTIKVVKKSKMLTGAWIGIVVGGGIGAVCGSLDSTSEGMGMSKSGTIPLLGAFGAVVGLLAGGIVGAVKGTDKIIQIEEMADSETYEALDKLRKKARIRNYK